MDWQEKLLQYARRNERETHVSEYGIGIEFEDGNDAFWILPGEAFSTEPVPQGGPEECDRLIERYEEIGSLRKQTIHVLIHEFTDETCRVDMSRDGQWCFQSGTAEVMVDVGPELTCLARKSNSVYEITQKLDVWWPNNEPSRKTISRHLNAPLPARIESLPDEDDEESSSTQTLAQVLLWLGMCKTIGQPEKLTQGPEAAALEVIQPKGRIGRAIKKMSELLPSTKASADCLNPGTISIEYSDGHDSMKLDIRSRGFTKRFRGREPEAVAEELVEKYLANDAKRQSVLSAIAKAAIGRGWSIEQLGFAFFGIEKAVFLGEKKREVAIDIGPNLTEAVQGGDLPLAIEKALGETGEFYRECVAALNSESQATLKDLPMATLRPREIPTPVELVELTSELVSELDSFAEQKSREVFSDEQTIWKYGDPNFYQSGVDRWAQPDQWLQLAEKELNKKWPDANAIKILMDNGDTRGEELAELRIAKRDQHYDEFGEIFIELVWRLRHKHPDVAREYLNSEWLDDYDRVLFRLGDPRARRRLSCASFYVDDPDADALSMASPENQKIVQDQTTKWAQTEHRFSPLDLEKLDLAGKMNWTAVFDDLLKNPFLLPGLLSADRGRPDCFDVPGLIMGANLPLVWSRYAPSNALARIVATAFKTDLAGMAREVEEADARGKPQQEAVLPSVCESIEKWKQELDVSLAIAWIRCRELVGG